MFTGIIGEVGKVVQVREGRVTITGARTAAGLATGDSVSVNGVCLTATEIKGGTFTADVMPETLMRTTLSGLSAGDRVNLETALGLGAPMGGHLVQGHIDAVGRVLSVSWRGPSLLVKVSAPPEVMRYVVEKGFIAVDGISLTVVGRDSDSFQVSVVDFTRRNTILEFTRQGDDVNLEADIIAKYVEQTLEPRRSGITPDFLREHGFITG